MREFVWRTHRYWSRLLPGFHRAYGLPTGGRVYLDITESPMMLARVLGRYEPDKHAAIDHFLADGDGFIDVGANKGDLAIHAALRVGPSGSVVAFEPEPTNCHWLSKSVQRSGVSNVVIERMAAGENESVRDLFLGAKSGWHSLIRSPAHAGDGTARVRVTSLDGYLKRHPMPQLKAVKIDVEGFEKEVLLGARQTLGNCENLVLFLDIHPNRGIDHNEIFEILRSHGFRLFEEKRPFDRELRSDAKPLGVVARKAGSPMQDRQAARR